MSGTARSLVVQQSSSVLEKKFGATSDQLEVYLRYVPGHGAKSYPLQTAAHWQAGSTGGGRDGGGGRGGGGGGELAATNAAGGGEDGSE